MVKFFSVILLSMIGFTGGCGSQKGDTARSEVSESPVYYGLTCYFNGSYYWIGTDVGSSSVQLQLNWGSVRDTAVLYQIRGTNNFEGYGQTFPGLQRRKFQVAFNRTYSSATVYFDERGYWVPKTTMPCQRN